MTTQITPLKLARYREILTGPVFPIHWDVDPSTVCDHACRGCPYIYDGGDEGKADPMLGVVREQTAKKNRQLLDIDAFATFVQEASNLRCKAITFVGGGEPTLHPRFTEMMEIVASYDIKFGVITHLGRTYDRRFFDALYAATWVRVSVNAGTRETYLRHQQKDHFDRAMSNVRGASRLGINIGVSFLVTNDNWHEIVQAADVAEEFGARYIQYKPIIEVGEPGAAYAGLEDKIAHELSLVRAAPCRAGFQVLDQWSPRLAELRDHHQKKFSGACHVPRFNPKLGANGVVYTCCELAYNDEAALGSIYETALVNILQRAGERCGQIDMAKCPQCWDKNVNTMINNGTFDQAVPPPSSVDEEFV